MSNGQIVSATRKTSPETESIIKDFLALIKDWNSKF